VAISNILTQKLELREDFIRPMILNSIRLYRKKYIHEYGEVVIVADAGGNWRKDVFPEYKAKRNDIRDESPFDWDEVYRILNKIRDEIKENFPYKVIAIPRVEADDIIGTLVEHTQEFGNWEKVMIISSDKDFGQLQKYDNVSQYSYRTRKPIVIENPQQYLIEHVFRGDADDGVPNVLSHDSIFLEVGTRQTPLYQTKIDAWVASDESQMGMDDDTYRNYLRNKKMIDLSETPLEIKTEIIAEYEGQDQSKNKRKVMNFLIKNACGSLLENTGDFIR